MHVTGLHSSAKMFISASRIQADAALSLIEGGTRAAEAARASGSAGDGLRTRAMQAQGIGQRLDVVA